MRRMKTTMCTLLAWACVITAQAEVWDLRLPETGLMPSYAKASYISRMHERHGGSHLGMQEYTLSVPFSDPRRSHVKDWWLSVQAQATVSVLDAGGDLDLKKDELFVFSLPITLIHPIDDRHKLMLTVMPRYAGDFSDSVHAWDLPIVLDYNIHHSDTLSYSVGLAASPRFAEYGVMPYIFCSWQATQDWLVRFRGYELAALYSLNDRLRMGPALSVEGGTWMVDTPRGQRVFRMRSLAATLLTEYNIAPAGKPKRMLSAAVGSTLATTAEFCNRTADKDAYESHHYKPGFMISLQADFRF